MKLVVYHHNGQLAEFPIDKVTGLRVENNHDEEFTDGHSYLNDLLHALANGKPLEAKHVTVSGHARKAAKGA